MLDHHSALVLPFYHAGKSPREEKGGDNEAFGDKRILARGIESQPQAQPLNKDLLFLFGNDSCMCLSYDYDDIIIIVFFVVIFVIVFFVVVFDIVVEIHVIGLIAYSIQ